MAYTYDLNFQEYILASMLGDSDFLRGNLEVFKPEYFNDDILRGIAEVTVEFYNREKDVPSKEAVLHELKNVIAPGRHYSEYSDAVERVFDKCGNNTQYYQGKAIEFAKSQSISNALQEAIVQLENGETENILKLLTNACRVGDNLGMAGVYSYLDTVKSRALDYKQSKESDPNRLTTGFHLLDGAMGGGLGLGELGIVVALPKSGKTTTLVNLAYAALLANKKVNYFTLELSKKLIASKFDARIFGQDLATIKKKPKSFYESVMKLKSQITGNLNIIEYATKTLTISKMQGMLEKIGVNDVTFVDYGQLIKPTRTSEARRHELTEIYEDLRRVAGEYKTRIWTAHQANRPGFGSKTIQSNNVAEDFNIVGVADFLMSFNQTEEERRTNNGRLYIMGSRIGDSGSTIPVEVNFKVSAMSCSAGEEASFDE